MKKICQKCLKEYDRYFVFNNTIKDLRNRKLCTECLPFKEFKGKVDYNKRKTSNQFICGKITSHNDVTRHRIREKAKIHKHSENTKIKISKIRKEFIDNHPEKVPYRLNHSSKESYPEKILREALIRRNIKYSQHYQIWKYEYDFAIVDLKIDIEVDGATHNLEKVKSIDRERDKWSISQRWSVLRFTAKEIKLNVEKIVDFIEDKIYLDHKL